MTYTLAIGDRAYSSWSLRGWLLFDAFNIPVTTQSARLYTDAFPELLAQFHPARSVPAMRTPDGTVVPDSRAIAEELASRHPDAGLLPNDPKARAVARVTMAEMHAGFRTLRAEMPMILGADGSHRPKSPGAMADVAMAGLSLGAATTLGATLGGAASGGWRPLWRKLENRLNGVQELTVEDPVLLVLADHLLDLARALEQRGHAAVDRLRVDDGQVDDGLQDVVHALDAARGHPDWDYVHQWVQESIDHSMIAVEPPATASPAPVPAAEPTTDAPTSDAPSTDEPTTDAPSTPAPAPAAPADPLAACTPGGQAG